MSLTGGNISSLKLERAFVSYQEGEEKQKITSKSETKATSSYNQREKVIYPWLLIKQNIIQLAATLEILISLSSG